MNRRLLTLAFSQMVAFMAMFLLAQPVRAQISSQTDVNTSKITGDQSECAVAKNPTNKLQLFVLCNNNAGAGLFAARSTDGGANWTYPDPSKTIANGVKPALGPTACCDPTLSWDTFGNLFIAYIDSGITTIEVLLSQDGGQTFTNITPASFSSCAGCPDQPTIVADTTTAVGAPVAVWLVWHRNAPTGPIVASGAAVTGLGAVGAFSAPQDVPGTANCSYGDVAISPAGAVVQTCQTPSNNTTGGGTILVNTKADGLGPNPFAAAVTATTTNVAAFYSIPAQTSRTVDAEAGLAYDRNNNPVSAATPLGPSPRFGRLYLVYTDATAAGSAVTNVMLRFSDDDGAHWSNPPIFVNDDSATNTTSKFFPKIASNRLSGNIAVCWYDARNSATNTAMQVFCTIATPTPPSPAFMVNGQISDGASTASFNGGNQFGDYSGLAYFQGLAHPAWPDTSNSTGDNPDGTTTFDIYSDRVSGGAAAHEGDPHLTTVNGVHYDFQGAGEFIVLRDYDGLEIQTRQAPIATTFNPGADPHDGLATCVSLNTAVAAQVGQHRVTYEPNLSGVPDPSGLQLRVDGDLATLGPSGIDFGDGGRIVKTAAPGGLEMDFPDETAMFITPGWWASQSKWYLNVDVSHTPALEGVLGVIPAGGWLPSLPNGTPMGPMPGPLHERYLDLYQKFTDAWRVTNKTSLFDYAPGTSTDTFTLRSWPLEKPPCILPRTKPVPPASLAEAEQGCRRITGKNMHADCVFDVVVSGNPGFAETYLLSQRIQKDSTTTTVSDDENPSQVGEWVTFTAIVRPNALTNKDIPTGTVQFTVDGSKVGMAVKLDSTGRAIWETSHLKLGEHHVAASYIPSEDSVFLDSSSLEELHTVKRCPCVSGGGDK
jgi:hypothetical protein